MPVDQINDEEEAACGQEIAAILAPWPDRYRCAPPILRADDKKGEFRLL
jgi:hypothetical protein